MLGLGLSRPDAIDYLKNLLSTVPLLTLYDVRQPVVLSVDASSVALGAVRVTRDLIGLYFRGFHFINACDLVYLKYLRLLLHSALSRRFARLQSFTVGCYGMHVHAVGRPTSPRCAQIPKRTLSTVNARQRLPIGGSIEDVCLMKMVLLFVSLLLFLSEACYMPTQQW